MSLTDSWHVKFLVIQLQSTRTLEFKMKKINRQLRSCEWNEDDSPPIASYDRDHLKDHFTSFSLQVHFLLFSAGLNIVNPTLCIFFCDDEAKWHFCKTNSKLCKALLISTHMSLLGHIVVAFHVINLSKPAYCMIKGIVNFYSKNLRNRSIKTSV